MCRLRDFRRPLSWTRLRALVIKESWQVLRDPSSLIIAFVLPPVLFFLFANAVSLDLRDVRLGVVLEGNGPAAQDLAAAYDATPYFRVYTARHRREVEPLLMAGKLRGYVVIPPDFDRLVSQPWSQPLVQVITDGSQPNTANFVRAYAEGVLATWYAGHAAAPAPALALEQRFWFNPELDSRRVLLPGAMAIIMTMIGTLLTAVVVAREWERGTMEAMMSTPAGTLELLLSKLAPYFLLGMLATLGCTWLGVWVYELPFRGSLGALLLTSAMFLVPALGQGLMISTLSKNQFVAAQISVFSGFMPAFILSGFLFEIDSMPGWLQLVTQVIPARHYVESLQSIFLAGDYWPELLRNAMALLAVGSVFFGITLLQSHKRLD
jgi:ABC-2 type transport system permease protein